MANRLAQSLSPYLRQHADNPVDWWEWGDEAFAEAQRRDVPILLSIGYAACHWCHVMAHESFEDDGIARLVNEHFVAIKVDREERPDVDAAYMAAVTATTGHGGWPMTTLLTPTGEPFSAGTYYPRAQFARLLEAAIQLWDTERARVKESGAGLAKALSEAFPAEPAGDINAGLLDAAVAQLARSFDPVNAGFGGAPKFPPSMVLGFLIRYAARTGSSSAMQMVSRTCEAMGRGGLYDQLAGGFARYAVDAQWVVPHFEKMLYDNAQLMSVYADWSRLGPAQDSAFGLRIACETADFVIRDLGVDGGGFASALDADTDGVEGLTYVWTPQQLADLLGEENGAKAADLLSVTAEGTFEHGSSTLQLLADPGDSTDAAWWQDVRERLLDARRDRPQPAIDDKVVTSWNGLAISGLVAVWQASQEQRYLDAATRAAEFLLATHWLDGRLRRTSREGVVSSAAGVADDYGNLAQGLLALHQATGDPRWLEEAGTLLAVAIDQFARPRGGFAETAREATPLFVTPPAGSDNAEPSGQSALSVAFLTYGALTGSTEHLELGRLGLEASAHTMTTAPRFAGWALAGAEMLVAGPRQLAIVLPAEQPHHDELLSSALQSLSPADVWVSGPSNAPGVPLLADRPIRDGEPTAYLCRGFVCDAPTTDPHLLREALAAG